MVLTLQGALAAGLVEGKFTLIAPELVPVGKKSVVIWAVAGNGRSLVAVAWPREVSSPDCPTVLVKGKRGKSWKFAKVIPGWLNDWLRDHAALSPVEHRARSRFGSKVTPLD